MIGVTSERCAYSFVNHINRNTDRVANECINNTLEDGIYKKRDFHLQVRRLFKGEERREVSFWPGLQRGYLPKELFFFLFSNEVTYRLK